MAASTEQIAEYFVRYLFEEYHGTRHVRRVATWIGFILKAINRVSGGTLQLSRTRQLTFKYKTHRFKARYNHQTGQRGGIQIVEVLPGRGAPVGKIVAEITNLDEAERIYHSLEQELDSFLSQP